jgi:WXG100 family type VII secretion target
VATSSDINVNPTELEGASHTLTQSASDLEATIASVRSQVAALQQFWVGDASTQFQELSDTFARSGSEMAGALASIATMLSQAARVYDEGEQALKGKFAI